MCLELQTAWWMWLNPANHFYGGAPQQTLHGSAWTLRCWRATDAAVLRGKAWRCWVSPNRGLPLRLAGPWTQLHTARGTLDHVCTREEHTQILKVPHTTNPSSVVAALCLFDTVLTSSLVQVSLSQWSLHWSLLQPSQQPQGKGLVANS